MKRVYAIHADVLTCLGAGLSSFERMIAGETGFSAAYECFPSWFADDKTLLGMIRSIGEQQQRIPAIIEMMIEHGVIPDFINKCDLILGACSLGDLQGQDAGQPLKAFNRKLAPHNSGRELDFMVSSACSSGSDALGQAFSLIAQNCVDSVAVIAADCIDPGKILQHMALGTLSIEGAKPFDQYRMGTTFGEGGGCVILVSQKMLSKWGIEPLCQISGFAMSCDAKDITAPLASGKWTAQIIKQATHMLPVPCYINAHGSGTQLNDLAENNAISLAYPDDYRDIPISSSKGACGHLLGATGLTEVVHTIWAMRHKIIFGSVGLQQLDEAISLNVIKQGQSIPCDIRHALSLTCGFGGVNSCISMSTVEGMPNE